MTHHNDVGFVWWYPRHEAVMMYSNVTFAVSYAMLISVTVVVVHGVGRRRCAAK
jgi:hypothetical protein